MTITQNTRQLTQEERLRLLRDAIANTCWDYAAYSRKRGNSEEQKRRYREQLADELLTEITDVRFIPIIETVEPPEYS